jgi:hypothetical protein
MVARAEGGESEQALQVALLARKIAGVAALAVVAPGYEHLADAALLLHSELVVIYVARGDCRAHRGAQLLLFELH